MLDFENRTYQNLEDRIFFNFEGFPIYSTFDFIFSLNQQRNISVLTLKRLFFIANNEEGQRGIWGGVKKSI